MLWLLRKHRIRDIHWNKHSGTEKSVNIYLTLGTFGFNLINMFVNNVSISILSDGCWFLGADESECTYRVSEEMDR